MSTPARGGEGPQHSVTCAGAVPVVHQPEVIEVRLHNDVSKSEPGELPHRRPPVGHRSKWIDGRPLGQMALDTGSFQRDVRILHQRRQHLRQHPDCSVVMASTERVVGPLRVVGDASGSDASMAEQSAVNRQQRLAAFDRSSRAGRCG